MAGVFAHFNFIFAEVLWFGLPLFVCTCAGAYFVIDPQALMEAHK
jgi:hypothetical protein